MRKIFFLLFLATVSAMGFAQEPEQQTSKGNWIASAYFGNATLKGVDKFKANANVAGGFLGRDFFLNENFSILTGITNMHVRADYFNAIRGQVFITNNSLQVPITFRYRGNVFQKTSYYIGAGIFSSYLYNSTIESESLALEEKEKGIGLSFGLIGEAGIKHQFTNKLNFSIGMRTQGDQFNSYKDSKEKFELTNLYVFEIGLGLVF